MSNFIRGIDHIGITVPDMEEATEFLHNAFGAKVAYDSKKPEEGVWAVKKSRKFLD